MLCPTGIINTCAFWETKSHPLKLAMGKNNLECEALRELFSSCLYHFVWCNCSTFRPKPSSPLFQHPCKHGGCTFMETPTAKHPPIYAYPSWGKPQGLHWPLDHTHTHAAFIAQSCRGAGTYRGALADEATAGVAGDSTSSPIPAGFAFAAVHHGVTATACEGEEGVRSRGRRAGMAGRAGCRLDPGSRRGCSAHLHSQVGTRICSR